jgi:IS605 OrfB family transposase
LSPWARLEKQFILRLPGEHKGDKRMLTTEEMREVHEIERSLGVSLPYVSRLILSGYFVNTRNQKNKLEELKNLLNLDPPSIPEDDTVKNFRPEEISKTAITVFSNLANILKRLISTLFSLSGVSKNLKEKSLESVIKALTILWYLSLRDNAIGKFGSNLWDLYAEKCPDDLGSHRSPTVKKGTWENKYVKNEENIKKFANWLINSKESEKMLQSIEDELPKFEKIIREAIKALRMRLFPSGEYAKTKYIQKMGGLSLERINALKTCLRHVMIPFEKYLLGFTKNKSGPEGTLEFDGSNKFKRETEAIRNLVEERLRHIANYVASAGQDDYTRQNNPYAKGEKHEPRPFKCCHVIVIEDLSTLRPNSSKTRMENKIISDLHSSSFKEQLKSNTSLYGLKLFNVQPSETSIIDSRTRSFGVRANCVSARKFMSDPFIMEQVDDALEQIKNGNNSPQYVHLKRIFDKLSPLPPDLLSKENDVYIPHKGGHWFVSSDPDNPSILNADLNASFNIGLRACTDPDWIGGHYKILVDTDTVPVNKMYNECQVIPKGEALLQKDKEGDQQEQEQEQDANKLFYLWRLNSFTPIDKNCSWLRTGEFYAKLRSMVALNLLKTIDPLNSGSGFDP